MYSAERIARAMKEGWEMAVYSCKKCGGGVRVDFVAQGCDCPTVEGRMVVTPERLAALEKVAKAAELAQANDYHLFEATYPELLEALEQLQEVRVD